MTQGIDLHRESAHRFLAGKIPRGWYYFCRSRDLRHGPVGIELGDSKYVAFRGADGRAVVLDARCSHMGADLSRGCVVGGVVHCPLHGWQYGGDGRCVRIPASNEIPPFAVQASFPTAEIGGYVAFYNARAPDFPMPFFEGKSPADLVPAAPLDFRVDAPWYLIGANAFDIQHFRVAHDRTLIDDPIVSSPSKFSQRIVANYEVTGSSLRDKITRGFSGARVQMDITVWAGTVILVTATFRRTTSYGMVFVQPLSESRTHMRTIVWVPRSKGAFARAVVDPVDAWIRRRFIRAFLMDDVLRAAGARYNPNTLVEADREISNYMAWLAQLTNAPAS